jgi:hypothetical protein
MHLRDNLSRYHSQFLPQPMATTRNPKEQCPSRAAGEAFSSVLSCVNFNFAAFRKER